MSHKARGVALKHRSRQRGVKRPARWQRICCEQDLRRLLGCQVLTMVFSVSYEVADPGGRRVRRLGHLSSDLTPSAGLVPSSDKHRVKPKVGVVFTCLDACLPLDQASLFGGLLPSDSELMVLRSAEELRGEPASDGVKSLLVAVHSMKAEYICVLRHKDCVLRPADGKGLQDQMVENGVNPAWLTGFDPAKWIRPMGDGEESLAKEITFLSEWSLIPPNVHVVGVMYDDARRRFTVIGNRAPNSPLVIFGTKGAKSPGRIGPRVKLKEIARRKLLRIGE